MFILHNQKPYQTVRDIYNTINVKLMARTLLRALVDTTNKDQSKNAICDYVLYLTLMKVRSYYITTILYTFI